MNDATARARELRAAGVSFSRLPAVLADRIRVCASGCWEWQGGRNQLGYGRVEWKGRRLYVHRLVFSLLDRPIPDGWVLDHLCRNRPCCNPAHLDLVTRTENSLRAVQVARERIAAPASETPDYRGRTGELAAATSGLPKAAIKVLSWRIAAKIRVNPASGCWEWQGKKNNAGYGRVMHDGRLQQAHRVVWSILRKPIPDGLVLDHLCRNTVCVNPDHLEPVTQQENTLRGETIAAANAARTVCGKGHEYTVRIVKGKAWRECVTCRNEGARKRFKERYATDSEFADRKRREARERARRKRAG